MLPSVNTFVVGKIESKLSFCLLLSVSGCPPPGAASYQTGFAPGPVQSHSSPLSTTSILLSNKHPFIHPILNQHPFPTPIQPPFSPPPPTYPPFTTRLDPPHLTTMPVLHCLLPISMWCIRHGFGPPKRAHHTPRYVLVRYDIWGELGSQLMAWGRRVGGRRNVGRRAATAAASAPQLVEGATWPPEVISGRSPMVKATG